MALRKVVVTGWGSISPYGQGVGPLMEGLKAGRSAVRNMKSDWETLVTDMTSWVGAPLNFEPDAKSISRKFRKTMGRAAILATLATRDAIIHSGLTEEMLTSGRTGVGFGSSTGSVESTEQFFKEPFTTHSMHQIPSGMFFKIMSHTAAANIAQTFNVKGRVISPNAACSSSAQAIGMGYEFIRNGIQDVMLCGGVDELHPMTNVSFDIVQAASYKFNEQPQRTPRPFDKDRDGTVCGEGAGCIVLESEESALGRGAAILGEVVGFATSSSGVHMAQADADSIAVCIREALNSAGLQAAEVDYINAHATGTLVGDVSEAQAIKQVFGNETPVSSLKGYFGHTLGASGVLEMIVSYKMMEEEILLPTFNLDEPDPECGGIGHLQEIRKQTIDTFVKNSFAFGGINTVLIGKRYAR